MEAERDPLSAPLAWPRFEMGLFYDANANHLVAAYANHALIIPLAPFDLPAEPFLHLAVESPATFVWGEETAVQLRPLDGEARLALVDAPEGMRIVDSALVWKPAPAMETQLDVTLRVSKGDTSREQTMEFEISPPYLDLGFTAEGYSIAPDGRFGVAWANQPDEDGRPTCRLALLDFANRRVEAGRVANHVWTAAADARHVYVSSAGRSLFTVLNHDFDQVKLIHTSENVNEFCLDAADRLIVVCGWQALEFSTEDWKLLYDSGDQSVRGNDLELVAPRPVHDGVHYRGMVFDRDMRAVRLLVSAPECLALTRWKSRIADRIQRFPLELEVSVPLGLRDGGRSGFAQSVELPVAAALRAVTNVDAMTEVLDFHEVVSGSALLSFALPRRAGATWSDSGPGFPARRQRLVWRGKTIFVGGSDRIYHYTLSDEQLAEFPPAFSFRLAQERFDVDPARTTTLAHAVEGADGDVTVELDESLADLDGLAVDERTGSLTVDGKALTRSILASGEGLPDRLQDALEERKGGESRIKQMIEASQREFETLIGRHADGVPLAVPIRLVARDATQRTALLCYHVFLEIPEDDWNAADGARARDRRK
jgi:hypothetical protein